MDAHHSVNVVTASCVEAGLLATLSMLQSKDAEDFIPAEKALHWLQR
ncbi:MAG: thiamine biosynthesis lipoprotein [Zhongshania sp.]|jgi:thiamine biosynthesis lipoprotein